MTRPSASAWAGLAVLTLLSYFQYPGHLFLESDTQIYVPMFEHFRDPGLLARDPMVVRSHTAFTLYDEITLAVSRASGLSLEGALGALHVLVRLALFTGIFLTARAMGLSEILALAGAGVYALGARVMGPSVLLVEYEPVPRAFALGPVALALGLVAHGRYPAAALAGAAAFLLHPTTAFPFWIVFGALLFVPDEPEIMKRRLYSLLALPAAMVLLHFAALWQPGVTERQPFFTRIDPAWEALIRERAPYVWVSLWPSVYFWQYGAMALLTFAAYRKLSPFVQPVLRFFWLGLCGLGLLSLPFSYLFLEQLKWGMLPQAQPLRTILFLELFALLGALVTAFELACREQRYSAAVWWAACALAIGIQPRLLFLLAPLALAWLSEARRRWAGAAAAAAIAYLQPFGLSVWRPAARRELLVTLGLAALLAAAAWLSTRRRLGAAAVAVVALAAFFAVPGGPRFHWSGRPRNPELEELIRWARAATPRDAVFLFADAGRSLEPGVFRALAARALYVDWKGGGQINFFPEFAREWRSRWQATLAEPYRPDRLPAYTALGIDYVVLSARNRLPQRDPAYGNARYLIYRLR